MRQPNRAGSSNLSIFLFLKLELGNPNDEALASRNWKLELPALNSQAGAWELANPQDGQDAAVMAWMEREEILFRTLERHLIADRLTTGFDDDVDGFISFSLSIQNRRKSRVGYALENHLQFMFDECGILYSRTAKTEQKSKPDFIFPGQDKYHNQNFDPLNLTMLGVKTSCKDRWRQVLSEDDRIKHKHLLTLETAISSNQTDEMQSKQLQLVLPRSLHATYSPAQQSWIMDIAAFIALVHERQELAIKYFPTQ